MLDRNDPYFDALETRSADAREDALARTLPAQVARAAALPGYQEKCIPGMRNQGKSSPP